MKIHGREVGFMLKVGASAEIAKLCPNNDISRLGELFGDDYVASIDIVSKIVVALNKGFEMAKSFEEQGYQPKPLTHEELMTLTTPQLMASSSTGTERHAAAGAVMTAAVRSRSR